MSLSGGHHLRQLDRRPLSLFLEGPLSLAIENNQKVWKSLEGDLRWGHNHLAADFFYSQASVKDLASR